MTGDDWKLPMAGAIAAAMAVSSDIMTELNSLSPTQNRTVSCLSSKRPLAWTFSMM